MVTADPQALVLDEGGAPEVTVLTCFATPVAVAILPAAERVNPGLATRILQMEEAEGCGGTGAETWQSQRNLGDLGDPAIDQVLAVAADMADQMTVDRQARPACPHWHMTCWANVSRRGQGTGFRFHPEAFWSGSYLIDDGGASRDPTLAGDLKIQDPRGVAPVMYAPSLSFVAPGADALGVSQTIRLRPGALLLHPGWVYHGVQAYLGSGTRISLAFDLCLPGRAPV